jgi:hypothetical protein
VECVLELVFWLCEFDSSTRRRGEKLFTETHLGRSVSSYAGHLLSGSYNMNSIPVDEEEAGHEL